MPSIFYREHQHEYQTYKFGYCIYCKRINSEPLIDIYSQGFLPYSGYENICTDNDQVFYMARSVRVNRLHYTSTSENRRVAKMFFCNDFIITEKPAYEYINDEVMIQFCLQYFSNRHGERIMNRERLITILSFSPEVFITSYIHNNQQCAYVIEIKTHSMSHYWFSCFRLDTDYKSLGMWLMLYHTTQSFLNSENHFYYIGTLYGTSALYKTNLSGIEYWNGTHWINNVEKLKELARSDS